MSEKQKTVIMPIIAVLALGIGNLIGLSQEQIDTLQASVGAAVAAGFTIWGLYGVWKNHDKKGGQK